MCAFFPHAGNRFKDVLDTRFANLVQSRFDLSMGFECLLKCFVLVLRQGLADSFRPYLPGPHIGDVRGWRGGRLGGDGSQYDVRFPLQNPDDFLVRVGLFIRWFFPDVFHENALFRLDITYIYVIYLVAAKRQPPEGTL